MNRPSAQGSFVREDGEDWYRIDHYDSLDPFFIALSGDSDLWAFLSTNGSLAAGRRDQDRSFFPYETVDKIHSRWETTGPRTWVKGEYQGKSFLWEPFARRKGHRAGERNLYKNLTGTRLMFEEFHADSPLVIRQLWSSAAPLGVVRRMTLWSRGEGVRVSVLDGLLNLLPPGLSNGTYNNMSSLADAYKWNEAHVGRLGVFTMYAQIWDRAEPKESFQGLAVWHSGLAGVPNSKMLLSAKQVEAFCQEGTVEEETLTRGRTSAFLVQFGATVSSPLVWYQVIDGPLSQAQVADLAARLNRGNGSPAEIEAALVENTSGLDELLGAADGFQTSADRMAAVHHSANVLFNIMRGGVFSSGTTWEAQDLRAFVQVRNRGLVGALDAVIGPMGPRVDRAQVLIATQSNPQLERLVREYLPLTFSRRHGDPSRPWNRFSIRVREGGRRVFDHQGNWRDIFQNWEALAWSQPEYIGSMIATFLSAMTPDGYNPYRIGRFGVEWEEIEEDDPWSFIGYWGDHQVVYLLRFLEAAQAWEPALLESLWHRPAFSSADVPYRIKPYAAMMARPKATIDFDHAAHERAMARAQAIGGDGKLVPGPDGQPALASLAEKLLTIVISKIGNLVPGGGIWLNTQRPEWNDANNALVGNGLSIVTLASLRRFLVLLQGLPFLGEDLSLPVETSAVLEQMTALARRTSVEACTDTRLRRRWMDEAGAFLETWRGVLYTAPRAQGLVTVPGSLVRSFLAALMPVVDTTLKNSRRDDGLYHSYNLLTLTPGEARVDFLYPMLEGQVALLSSGLFNADEALSLGRALRASDLYVEDRRSYLLYPDRPLPGFLQKNCLDAKTLALAPVKAILADPTQKVFETQADGTVRFVPALANRYDVEAALAPLGDDARVVGEAFEALLGHKAFTGRSGTMFGYEGLGCIYWHMVAKLLLAVQENVFAAADIGSPRTAELVALYHEIRSGLGYHKTPAEYGAFPFDPYSHTPGEAGAQQPGMTGQVKEEVLTRWGELGLRWKSGRLFVDPVLLDRAEIPEGGALEFTFQRIPFAWKRSEKPYLKVKTSQGWLEAEGGFVDLKGALAVEGGF